MMASQGSSARISCLPDAGYFATNPAMENWMFKGAVRSTPKGCHHSHYFKLPFLFLQIFHNASHNTVEGCRTSISEPWRCMLVENVLAHVKTPLFAIQPKYDAYVITNPMCKLDHVLGFCADRLCFSAGRQLSTRLFVQ